MKNAIRLLLFTLLTLSTACGGSRGVISNDLSPTSDKLPTSSDGGIIVEAATATLKPSEIPVPEAIESAEVFEINTYISGETLYFIGIVRNTGNVDLAFVEVHVTLRDSGDKLIMSESSYSARDVIPVGEASPFNVLFYSETPDYAKYEVTVEGRENTMYQVYKEFEIVSADGQVPSFWDYEIAGEIRNIGSSDAEFVSIIAVLYDAENHIIGLDTTYSDFDVVTAGGTSPFSILFLSKAEGVVDHFEFFIEGRIVD